MGRKYERMGMDASYELEWFRQAGEARREIDRLTARHGSTISREPQRNA